ncbi:MAG: hypothetical protein ACKVOP_07825 [Sphingomonadaceae bacterium]
MSKQQVGSLAAGSSATTVESAEKTSHSLTIVGTVIVTLVVSAALMLAVAASNGGQLSSVVYALTPDALANKNVTANSEMSSVVDGVFGTIQFAIAVLSSLVLVISVGVTYFMGRNARQTQETARAELAQVAQLYRDNISALSDSIEARTQKVIAEYVKHGEVKNTLQEYQDLLSKLNERYTIVKPIVDDFDEFQRANLGLDADFVGSIDRLSAEEDKKLIEDPNFKLGASQEDRAILQQALRRVQEGGLRRAVSSNDCFNAAQIASRTNMHEMSHRLATLAYWLEDRPLYMLRTHRAEFERGDRYVVEKDSAQGFFRLVSKNPDNDPAISEQLRHDAYQLIVDSVPKFPSASCELLYSEVWNIFVHGGQFAEYAELMLEAERRAHNEGRYVPSYVNASVARAASIHGEPGWRDLCVGQVRIAVAKLEHESPAASWVPHAKRDLQRAMTGGQLDPSEVFDAVSDDERERRPTGDASDEVGVGMSSD